MEKKGNMLRVLLDCSLGILEYGGGISLDTRMMLETFSGLKEVEVEGLIYSLTGNVLFHRFKKNKVDRGHRVYNQAFFLASLLSEDIPWSRFMLIGIWQRLIYYYSLLVERNVKTDVLETEILWSMLWRNFFSNTLPSKDIPIIQKGRFLLARLGNNTMFMRSSLKLPQPRLDTKGYDFVIFQDSRPVRVSDGTIKLIRYHDTIPITSIDVMHNIRYSRWHYLGIKDCIEDSFYVCNSEPTREDIVTLFPMLEDKSFTIPYALPTYYYPEKNTDLFCDILKLRLTRRPYVHEEVVEHKAFNDAVKKVDQLVKKIKSSEDVSFILHIATLEPRKNLTRLMEAFQLLKSRIKIDVRLLVVGNLGWKWELTLEKMRPFVEMGELIHLEWVPYEELRVLYSHATVFAFPSLEEGFGLPPVEAMLCGTPVAVSDIRQHRWVMGDAAVYFNPYSTESIAEALKRVLEAGDKERRELIEKGFARAKLYSAERVGDMWKELFVKLKERVKTGR